MIQTDIEVVTTEKWGPLPTQFPFNILQTIRQIFIFQTQNQFLEFIWSRKLI